MRQFLTDIFTGKDGLSFDMGRVLWAGSCLYGWGLEGYDVVIHHIHFDIVAFGTGNGLLFAAGAAGLRLKAPTEPGGPKPD